MIFFKRKTHTVAPFVARQKEASEKEGKWHDVNFLPCAFVPMADGLPHSFLLDVSFSLSGRKDALRELTESLQKAFGANRTVWGCKLDGQTMLWEYYWYYHFLNPLHALPNVASVLQMNGLLSGHVDSEGIDPHYYILSVEIGEGPASFFCIYYPENHVGMREEDKVYFAESRHFFSKSDPVGVEYKYYLNNGHVEEGNKYRVIRSFYDNGLPLRDNLRRLAGDRFPQLAASDHLMDFMALPFLSEEPFSVSLKADGVGLYFSRLKIGPFLSFLSWAGFPEALQNETGKNTKRLAPLLFDISFTINLGENGRLRYARPAFYGSF